MALPLSPRPDLEQIRRQAKELLRAHREGDPGVCARLRLVPRLADMTDGQILAGDVKLQEAQHALAKEYGFATWAELKRHVESTPSPSATVAAMDEETFLATCERNARGRSSPLRRAILDRAMSVADGAKGTPKAARALLTAANAYVPACGDAEPLTADGWDRNMDLCRRVMDENPETDFARQAQWYVAMAHGCWAPNRCCHPAQGKRDWPKAMELYRQIHDEFAEPASRREALCRIAEIQLARTSQWREGLATWQQCREEFPRPVGRSAYETARGCGREMSEEYFLMTFGFRPVMENAASAEEAAGLREEFVRRAPQVESIRTGTMVCLASRLRGLGDVKQAEQVRSRLGFLERWLVVGPFSGSDGLVAEDLKAANLPAELRPMARSMKSWWDDRAPASMVEEMLTAYGPEADYLAGRLDLRRVYPFSPAHEVDAQGRSRREGPLLPERQRGDAAWVASAALAPTETWDTVGTVYGLAHVQSPSPRTAQLRAGLSGRLKVWLNGDLVLANDELHDYTSMDSFIVPVSLIAGRNEVFVKFTPYGGGEPVSIRVTDDAGVLPEGVTFSAPAEPRGNRRKCDFIKPKRTDRPASQRLGWLHR
jgi:hypothetical protein